MIHCPKRQEYIYQDEECMHCIFYDRVTDSCDYEDWIPGLIQKIYDESNTD
jgi:hypothetical protein